MTLTKEAVQRPLSPRARGLIDGLTPPGGWPVFTPSEWMPPTAAVHEAAHTVESIVRAATKREVTVEIITGGVLVRGLGSRPVTLLPRELSVGSIATILVRMIEAEKRESPATREPTVDPLPSWDATVGVVGGELYRWVSADTSPLPKRRLTVEEVEREPRADAAELLARAVERADEWAADLYPDAVDAEGRIAYPARQLSIGSIYEKHARGSLRLILREEDLAYWTAIDGTTLTYEGTVYEIKRRCPAKHEDLTPSQWQALGAWGCGWQVYVVIDAYRRSSALGHSSGVRKAPVRDCHLCPGRRGVALCNAKEVGAWVAHLPRVTGRAVLGVRPLADERERDAALVHVPYADTAIELSPAPRRARPWARKRGGR